MPHTINVYVSGDFDANFLNMQAASGPLTSLTWTRMVYGTTQTISPGSIIFVTPQLVLNGSGFTNGSDGTVNSIILGAQGVPNYQPGSSPYFTIFGLNVSTATFLQDELAAIRSDAITFNGSSGRDILPAQCLAIPSSVP